MKITLKTAKLAKEKGFNSIRKQDVSDSYYNRFNGETFHFYMNDEFVVAEANSNLIFGLIDNYQGKTTPYEYYLAPTQSELQKWLREVHNLFIIPDYNGKYEYTKWFYTIKSDTNQKVFDSGYWETYEKCLEEGLFAALNLI